MVDVAQVWTNSVGTNNAMGGHLGLAGNCKGAFTSTYTGRLAKPDIMLLEALAVLHALKLWAADLNGYDVKLWIDNESVYDGLLLGSIP
jgi:hypothetical protein